MIGNSKYEINSYVQAVKIKRKKNKMKIFGYLQISNFSIRWNRKFLLGFALYWDHKNGSKV